MSGERDIRASWPAAGVYGALEARILTALRADLPGEEFNRLALEIHAFQRTENGPYARWCATLPPPRSWKEIPAVPQAMFKRFRLACFPEKLSGTVFRTSGTTGETRGEHHFLNTHLYRASVLAGWRRLGLPKAHPILLTPRPTDAPHSSLSEMMQAVANEISPGSRPTWLCKADGSLDTSWLDACTHASWSAQPVALLGTALAFLRFFEVLESPRLLLSPGSYAMETGGFKGSGRDLSKSELYGMFHERLGLEPGRVWNEYGMCELSSQFYTRGIGSEHTSGPWMRALVVSPETGAEVPIGETGVLRIFDLANLGSVLAVQTADLAVRREEGFELLERDPAAGLRGCSRQADEAMRPAAAPTARGSASVRPFRAAAPRLSCEQRAMAIAEAAEPFSFLGEITAEGLLGLVASELGDAEALDRFVASEGHHVRAVAPHSILHILSGNTPAAALQTLIRGVLLGSRNWCKLPSRGLPEVDEFIAGLPQELREDIRTSITLPDEWLERAHAIIVFGSDETVAHFRARAQPWQTFIAHGHQLSFGMVLDDPDFSSVPGAAHDASIFDQQGCLSPHVYYVRERAGLTARAYAARLAVAMAEYESRTPRGTLALSESHAIRSLREEIGFRAASGEALEMHASPGGTAWTVIADGTPGFPATPLNRVVFVKPLPEDLGAELAGVRPYLSTCGLWPADEENAQLAASTGVTRICRIGEMQRPPLTWHQGGRRVLAPLVRWIDWEG